jgi:hypothetical protein
MQSRDRLAFAEVMHAVHALYRVDLSEAVLGIWWEAMRSYDLAEVQHALNRHAMNPDNGQYLPKPADVVRLLQGSTLDVAHLAWTKLMRAVSRAGAYQSVVFDDPLMHAVVSDMGGWPELCRKRVEEIPFAEREFVERYRGYRVRGGATRYPSYLPGLAEQHNAAAGLPVAPPVLLGDAARARAVLSAGADSMALAVTPIAQLLPEHIT